MPKKVIELIGINIFVFILMLFSINLGIVVMYEVFALKKNIVNYIDPRSALPNYRNIEWAQKHFQEFNELRSEYKSYIGWRRLPFKGETINIDKNGIRYTPQSESVTDNSLTVAFLGGSTMWGTGVNDENTIPAFFSKISHGRYRTVNLGESNYRAFQGFIFLKQQIDKGLQPDIAIAYDGVNEVHGFRPELEPSSHGREDQIRSVMKGQDRGRDLSLRNFLLGPIEAFIPKLKNRFGTQVVYDLSDERAGQVAKALLDSWMSTKALAEQNGALFIAVLQPNVAVGNPQLDHLEIDSAAVEPYRRLYPMILKLLQGSEYRDLANHFIDLSSAFDVNEYIYIDNIHVSPNGNKIIAQKIYNRVESNLKSESESSR